MAFSTQRDFMNYPPCISTDSAYSDDDVGFGRPTPTSTSASYSTFLQDLTNLWNRLSGRPPTRIRPQGGEERPSIPAAMSSSESDSGVNTEVYQDTTTNRVAPSSRYVEPDEPDETDVISSRDLLDGVEDILLKLETEGKLTIDHVMNLIRKYQDYIKSLLIDGQVPEGGLKKLLEYIESTCEEMSKAIKGLGISEQAKNILMEDVNTLSSAMKTYMCESKRENDAMYQELQKANFDRQSLQISLQKLSNVEDRIVDLKAQAAKAYGMEKEIKDLKDQLEKVQNNNHVLVQRLMQAKTEHNEEEEKHKTDCEKIKIEMQKWKCKAEMLNDLHQRDMLEIDKWKVHSSRLSLELDKATERVLRGHETKRKLYFAESMRCELERQIEEMMTIIKQLTEQKPSLSVCQPAKPKDCQNVLSNLLIESKNTLKTILSNVRQDYNTNQSYLDDKFQQQLKKVREENLQLKKEITELQVEKPSSSKKSYEDQIRKLQEELDKCRSKNNENNTNKEELDQLRNQLEKCQEENANLRKKQSTSPEESADTRRLTDENQSLKEQLEKLQNENSILKDVMNVKAGSTSEREQSSTNQVIVVDLQQSDEGSSNNYSQKTQKSDADHGNGNTEGIIVGPKTETSHLTRSDEFDILSSKLCKCEKALDCLRSEHEASEGCSCSGSESSFLSYSSDSDSEPGFDIKKTLGDMAEVESLLRKKNERIEKLEKQCFNLNESIVKLTAEKQMQMAQSANIVKLEKELSKFKEELQDQRSLLQLAKDHLKVQNNDIKDGQKMLTSLQAVNNVLVKENSRLQEEKSARDVVKSEKDRHNGSLRSQEIDCEKLEEELSVARQLVEQSRQEFNDKVRGMLEEKDKLEAENLRLSRELQSLDSIVDEVNVERAKNRKMEALIADLETQIESVQKRDPEHRFFVEEAKFPQIIACLKAKLEEETNENNKLREQRLTIAKEIDELKKMLTFREQEIEQMKKMADAPETELRMNAGSSPDDSRDQCIQHINQLKTELDSEKHRYYKLRTKFVNYSEKIKCLEEKLRAKRADLEQGMACEPSLQLMSERQKGGTSNTISTDQSIFEELFKKEKTKNKKLTTKLVVEFIKNEKLSKDLMESKNKLAELSQHANIKTILEKFSDENIELSLVEAGNEDGVGIEGAESLSMVEMARDFQGISDQLKKELQTERQTSQKLQTQIDSDRLKTEQLKCKVKKLKTRNSQLRNTIKRHEKSIIELQSTVDGLTSITTLEDKEVQTSSHDLKDYGGELDTQLRKNFELAQDYSKEIATNSSLRNDLKQAQREVRKLCKCIEEVEKEKEALKRQNDELKSMLESTKAACTNSTCCNGNCCCKKPRTLSQKIGSELKSGQTQVQKESSESNSAKTNIMNVGPSLMKSDNNSKAIGNRIRQICNKIQEAGIGALDPKDLTYLHREVYAAGKRLRISESESTHDKCWEFVTNLPPIPANKEEKIMARVSYLETELDNANQVLQHLKKEYEKESRIDGRERHRGGENRLTLPNNLFCEIPSWQKDYHRSF